MAALPVRAGEKRGLSMVDGRARGFTESSIPDAYDRFMLSQLFEPWANDLLSRVDLQTGRSALSASPTVSNTASGRK